MATTISLEGFEKALRLQYTEAAESIVAEEIEKAQKNVDARMRGLLAKTVMQISSWYSIEFQQNKVIIEVKNQI